MNAILLSLDTKKTKFRLVFPGFPEAILLAVFGKRRTKKCRHTFLIQSWPVRVIGQSFTFSASELQLLFSEVMPNWHLSTFQSSFNDNLTLSITSLIFKYFKSPINQLVLSGKYFKTINNTNN